VPSLDWYDCPIVIPYYGGKYEMSKKLIPLISPHDRYFEVFAGGLSMFFRKTKAKWNVLNDKDNDIVNLYMCVLLKKEELVKNLFWLPKSRELFLNFKQEIRDENNKIQIPDPLQAAKYLYCIRYSFNKLIHTPFSMNKDMNKNWDKELEYSRNALGGATIENLDFFEIVDKYKPRKKDFWYLDPPYIVATEKGTYYNHSFTMEDHERLREAVQKIHDGGAHFMVSYDYREEVAELYKDFDCRTLDWKYTGATDEARLKERKEYVIINYEPVHQMNMFKEI